MDILPYDTEEEYNEAKARTEATERLRAEAAAAAHAEYMRPLRQTVCGDAFDFVSTQLTLLVDDYEDAPFYNVLKATADILPVLRNSVGTEPQTEPEAE